MMHTLSRSAHAGEIPEPQTTVGSRTNDGGTFDDEREEHAAFKGILVSVLLGVAIWSLIALLVAAF